MPEIDLKRLLNEPIYAFDFQFMIGDIEDFLDYSESNIEWQYKREIQSILHKAEAEDLPQGCKEHLETNAEHRFKISLPLRVRYGALLSLTISVEWSVGYLVEKLVEPLKKNQKEKNFTVHALFELDKRAGIGATDTIQDYEALVHVRNCIAHNAGIEKYDKYHDQLITAVDRLSGFSLGNWHYFGKHIYIDREALNPYIKNMGNYIVQLHKSVHEKGLLQENT